MTMNGINILNGATMHPDYTGLSYMQLSLANSFYEEIKDKPLENLENLRDSLASDKDFFGFVEDILENAGYGVRRPKFCAVKRALSERIQNTE